MSTSRDGDEPASSQLNEDFTPDDSPAIAVANGDLNDFTTPDDSPTYKTTPVDVEGMESKTRRALAYGSGIVLAAFYTATFILHATGVFPDLGNIMSMFSGLQTLTAAAFGFYFAKGKGN